MKAFLANPPWSKMGRLGVRAGSRWAFTMTAPRGATIPPYVPFPFFLAYAAAVLERAGVEVTLLDAIAEGTGREAFLDRVAAAAPDLVLFETSTPSIDVDLALAREVKERLPGTAMALSGPHASALPGQIIADYSEIDYVLMGEYEHTLRDLAACIEHRGDPGRIPGLAWRNHDGQAEVNERRALVQNLDELPWPARHLLPMHNYHDDFAALPMPGLQMWASRGCPFRCIFCVWPKVMYGGHAYRVRDPIDVVNEMEDSVKRYALCSVSFDDDTFDIGKPRILQLCQEIERRRLGIPWTAMARADTADREMLEAMARAGLWAIKYGVESGVQELVNAADKSLNLDRVQETVRITRDLGVKVHLTFTLGLPGETMDSIQRTLDFVLRLDPDSVQFSIATPYPGTTYYELAREKGLLVARDWSDFDGADRAVVRTEMLSPEELEGALITLRKRWNRHRFRRDIVKRPGYYVRQGLNNPGLALQFLQGKL